MTLWNRRGRIGLLLALAILFSLAGGCGKDSTPTGPSAVTSPQATDPSLPNSPTSVSITGVVAASSGGGPIASARVEVTSGAQSGQSATTDASGRYLLNNLTPCSLTLRISAFAYVTQSVDLTIASAVVNNVTLTPVPFQTRGYAFDLDSNSAVAGVTMTGDSVSSSASSPSGTFVAVAADGSNDPRAVLLAGPGVVQRRTFVRVPGPDLTLSLIPSAFDLTAFDQMLRTPMLYRWSTPPPLIIERRTLHFTSSDAGAATAESDIMTDGELATLEADLRSALGPMTGGTFQNFAGVTRQAASAGDTVNILNAGSITVVRMAGLTAATGFWGFGRYLVEGDGTVTGGIVMLDRDFERSGNPSLRTLRTHELGHALGYNHVTVRQSVMSPDATTMLTAWDGVAFRIAFTRPPGNRSPDTDPSLFSMNAVAVPARWSKAVK